MFFSTKSVAMGSTNLFSSHRITLNCQPKVDPLKSKGIFPMQIKELGRIHYSQDTFLLDEIRVETIKLRGTQPEGTYGVFLRYLDNETVGIKMHNIISVEFFHSKFFIS